jgi:hypothetical protein
LASSGTRDSDEGDEHSGAGQSQGGKLTAVDHAATGVVIAMTPMTAVHAEGEGRFQVK